MQKSKRRLRVADLLLKRRVVEISDVQDKLSSQKADLAAVEAKIEVNEKRLKQLQSHSANGDKQNRRLDPVQLAGEFAYYSSLCDEQNLLLEQKQSIKQEITETENEIKRLNKRKKHLEEMMDKTRCAIQLAIHNSEMKAVEELCLERAARGG